MDGVHRADVRRIAGLGRLNAIHPDDRENTTRLWATAMEQRTVYQFVNRLRHADGEYRHMSGRAVPMLSLGGEIREWIGVHVDVTDQFVPSWNGTACWRNWNYKLSGCARVSVGWPPVLLHPLEPS